MNEGIKTLIIYSRKECCLCNDMLDGLKPWQEKFKFKIKTIDIDEDPLLIERYAARIPLLAVDELEICQYYLDEDALASYFHDAI